MASLKTKQFLDFLGKSYVAFWYYILIVLAIGTVGKITQVCDARRRVTLEREFFSAMKENDSERAIYYAKKLAKRKDRSWRRSFKGVCPFGVFYLGYAFELSGDLDAAAKTYEEESGRGYLKLNLELARARIAYKKGDFQRAFICYYNAVRLRDLTLKPEFSDDYIKSFEWFRDYDLFGIPSTISPFADFWEFLSFMEEECAKVGNPQEYAPTITLLYRLQQESERRAQENNRKSKPDAAVDKESDVHLARVPLPTRLDVAAFLNRLPTIAPSALQKSSFNRL